MIVLFWISAAIVGYVYVGYPCLVALWARLADRRPRRAPFAEGRWPAISIVIAARNEAARLPARVRNLLDQRYPGPCEILVVSDGSTDDPQSALAEFGSPVRVIELPPGGKPLALNAGVAAATGEILVFADARQRYAPGALRELVTNFADPGIGGATGELVLDCEQHTLCDSSVGEGIGVYWMYEKWLRRNESRVWCTLGATGAIYALRRACWTPLPARTLVDDVLAPMRAVLNGCRVVFEERAIACDHASTDAASESRRKTRTLAGNYQILLQEPRLLLPFANPVWLQYLSHKVGRLLVPWALLGLFASTLAIAPAHPLAAVVLALQGIFYGLAIGAAVFHARERLARIAYTFVMMNLSAVAGLAALRRGREVWR
jgi:cellulose synthase/poly-beta-1,6-N-acetylglucosamine synthase-like glycosyltransferase